MKIVKDFISLDVESNGLHGKPYAVAMVMFRNGELDEKIVLQCPILQETHGEKADWIEQNPHLENVAGAENCTYMEMLQKAAKFFNYHSCRNSLGIVMTNTWGYTDYGYTPILFHCGMVVECNFFRELVTNDFIGYFDAPQAPIEVADFLRLIGENPTSVDSYIEKVGIEKADGETHNPLFDAMQAANAYLHIAEVLK